MHTPTDLHVSVSSFGIRLVSKSGYEVAEVYYHGITDIFNFNRLATAWNSYDDLLKACETGVKWMRWWLNRYECECEGPHTCGRTKREVELRSMEAAIAKAANTEGREVPNANQG